MMTTPRADPQPRADQAQRQASTRTWASGGLLRRYRGRNLRPAEEALFAHQAQRLRGRVLELGCGGGRLTGHLVAIGATVHGIDIAAKMVAYCERTYPLATFSRGELRDAGSWGQGPWDALVAGWALIDVLSDEERATFFDGRAPSPRSRWTAHLLLAQPRLRAPHARPAAQPPRREPGQPREPVAAASAQLPQPSAPDAVAALRARLRDPQRRRPRLLAASLLHHPRRPGAPASPPRVRAARVLGHRRGSPSVLARRRSDRTSSTTRRCGPESASEDR